MNQRARRCIAHLHRALQCALVFLESRVNPPKLAVSVFKACLFSLSCALSILTGLSGLLKRAASLFAFVVLGLLLHDELGAGLGIVDAAVEPTNPFSVAPRLLVGFMKGALMLFAQHRLEALVVRFAVTLESVDFFVDWGPVLFDVCDLCFRALIGLQLEPFVLFGHAALVPNQCAKGFFLHLEIRLHRRQTFLILRTVLELLVLIALGLRVQTL